jgi:hypothetical protein
LNQAGGHRVVTAGHHQDSGPYEKRTQTFGWRHGEPS